MLKQNLKPRLYFSGEFSCRGMCRPFVYPFTELTEELSSAHIFRAESNLRRIITISDMLHLQLHIKQAFVLQKLSLVNLILLFHVGSSSSGPVHWSHVLCSVPFR